jgi:hypothetical protein
MLPRVAHAIAAAAAIHPRARSHERILPAHLLPLEVDPVWWTPDSGQDDHQQRRPRPQQTTVESLWPVEREHIQGAVGRVAELTCWFSQSVIGPEV